MKVVLVILFIVLCAGMSYAKSVTIVDNGNAKAVILISSQPDSDENFAAKELVEHIEKISGCRIGIVQQSADKTWQINPVLGNKGICYIFIGSVAMTTEMEKAIRSKGTDPARSEVV
ncbi:MAG: hypothetical protein ACPL3Q_03650 [Candidatus Ratteibacteria bacterium]